MPRAIYGAFARYPRAGTHGGRRARGSGITALANAIQNLVLGFGQSLGPCPEPFLVRIAQVQGQLVLMEQPGKITVGAVEGPGGLRTGFREVVKGYGTV